MRSIRQAYHMLDELTSFEYIMFYVLLILTDKKNKPGEPMTHFDNASAPDLGQL